MKPQKKAIVAQKAPKSQPVSKKRNKIISENLSVDSKKVRKINNIDIAKKLANSEEKKVEKLEKCKKIEEKKRKDSKVDKMDDKKKLNKDVEKKFDMVDEKKIDKMNDRVEEFTLDVGSGTVEKKKNVKSDDKVKIDKQLVDSGKKKIEKGDDKKKVCKEDALENDPSSNSPVSEENVSSDDRGDIQNLSTKKKGIREDEKKKKDGKSVKSELKDSWKNTATKDKKLDLKKLMESHIIKKTKSIVVKKDLSPKNLQKKLSCTKKTVVVKKTNAQLGNKLVEKKSKLVKGAKEESSMSPEEDEQVQSPKAKKKSCPVLKNKLNPEKKPKLAKQMKAKIPTKNGKINNILKTEKLKKITDKIVMKKKMEMKEHDKVTCDINKKILKEGEEEQQPQPPQIDNIKKEILNDKEDDETLVVKSPDSRKCSKGSSKPRVAKKFTKKSTKSGKSYDEDCDKVLLKAEDSSNSDSVRQSKGEETGIKSPSNSKRDIENPIKMDLKVETSNGDSSENQTSPSDSDNDYVDELEARKNRQKKKKKINPPEDNVENDDDEDEDDRDEDSSSDEQKRMRLLDFWSGPKRRVASLNALAKVHCMYENEAGGVYLGGYCKPKPEKDKPKKASSAVAVSATKDDKEESSAATRKEKDNNKKTEAVSKSTSGNNVSKRNLRNVPGLRGKHWDMVESSTSPSSSSTSDEDESATEQIVEKTVNKRGRKKNTTVKKKKNEEVMDLKDMVVCKRMASLNASAMLAASYSDEKNRNSSSSESSSDSEVEIIKRRKPHGDTEADRRKARQDEEALKSSKKVVIVNQDTDVTITGVYVNQTRSTHHEGFCSIAGMQYRISSTSHTQTAATAVAAELHEQQKVEPPCKSYTPLGALSSMQPPGSQGSHPNMSPRRHSAFTAPHQHGYYQPAGPLIQHPPTLPPIKGPPPEPTPTPPQNSEGSDDLVATSTTSGGTNSTGNSWRSYRKTESRVASSAIPSTSIVPTGGGFYRAYCPQYYGTPPQYQELCYPPTYPHPHPHPPPYYKYAPAYRRQYYGYPEAGGGTVAGGAGAGALPGVVEYPPPPPGEYPMPPYYGGYPPPPPPPPPPPNPAYLHSQGRPIVDHAAFQGCPCPMQSCPKNVDTGPLIGNGKGAPVASGPGLSLPPSALVGPPSPARGLAGLAPPHGANAWGTDRVQLNNHRNLNQNQQLPTSVAQHNNIINDHCRSQTNECQRTKDEKPPCTDDKMSKCSCQKRACTSTCEVKLETLSPTDTAELPSSNLPTENLRELKLENNNVKCESCSVGINDNISCAANCNVKCETTDFKCEIIKCEECMKEGQIAILEIDKDSGILLIDDKLEVENGVKEELNDVVVVESQNWIKPDYEATVTETIEEDDNNDNNERTFIVDELPKCQKVVKRKLSLDSLSSSPKKRKVNKRTLSVGSSLEITDGDRVPNPMNDEYFIVKNEVDESGDLNLMKKKQQLKKESNKRKIDDVNSSESAAKKSKSTKHNTITNGITQCLKSATTDTSIMETINDVIEQSVQMTNKKDIKCKQERNKIDKKKKTVNLMSIIKKVPKTLVKAVVAEKMCISKNEMKNIKELKTNKFELKNNNKVKLLENNKCKNKVKAKIVEIKSKVFDSKAKVTDIKMKELTKKIDATSKTKLVIDDKCEDIKKAALVKKKIKKSTKKTSGKKLGGKIDDNAIVSENCSLTKKQFLKPKWSNGWSWEGESYEAKVYLTNEESAIRRCYESMRHVSGDVLRPRDCVLLKSGPRKADLPFVAKIAALWENPDDGEMMFSLLWYYRPEHTEQGRTDYDTEDEVFASRHRDANSVACIEDKCYILTFNEYCRYRKNLRRIEEGLDCPGLIVPPGEYNYPRENRQPPIPVPSDIVLFCRRVYDYRGKKLVKNPG